MMVHIRKALVVLTVILLAVMAYAALSASHPVAAKIQSFHIRACQHAVYVTIEMDNVKDAAPAVSYRYGDQRGDLRVTSSHLQPVGDMQNIVFEYFVYIDKAMDVNSTGLVYINGGQVGEFKVSGDCPVLGRIVGTAFLDRNQNGKREKSEPIFPSAWMKITGGGVWFVCGWVGTDATFGVPVTPGTYFVMPVAPQGYRTTTPRITVEIKDLGYVAFDTNIGFVKDPKAAPDACDQYNPPRP